MCHDSLQLEKKRITPKAPSVKWAVKNADRRWYISEFVEYMGEGRVKGSDRLPVISRIPRVNTHP